MFFRFLKLFSSSITVLSVFSLCSGTNLYNLDYSKLLKIPSLPIPSIPAYSQGHQQFDSPVYSNHHLNIAKVRSSVEREEVPMIVIDSNAIPIKMLFRTASAKMDIKQEHQNAQPNVQETNSVDGEIVLKHTVKKPIVQYVYEEILPSRYLTQKIAPVKEFVKTIVTKNDPNGSDKGSGNDGNVPSDETTAKY